MKSKIDFYNVLSVNANAYNKKLLENDQRTIIKHNRYLLNDYMTSLIAPGTKSSLPKMRHLPTKLQLELNSSGNLKCSTCMLKKWDNGVRHGAMSIKTAKSCIDANECWEEVNLTGIGEPLLHPDLIFRIRELRKEQGYLGSRRD